MEGLSASKGVPNRQAKQSRSMLAPVTPISTEQVVDDAEWQARWSESLFSGLSCLGQEWQQSSCRAADNAEASRW